MTVRIGLFGNCQLETLQAVFRHPSFAATISVVGIPPVHKIRPEQHAAFRAAVEAVDVLYLHYTSSRHGLYATEAILPQAGDKARMLPNLECRAFTPQLGYFTDDVPLPGTDYVDYRVLGDYLAGRSAEDVATGYETVEVDGGRCRELLAQEAARHKALFDDGKVIFDYSPRLSASPSSRLFWTFNHPGRSELEWLINQILADLELGRTIQLEPELLDGNRVPVLPTVAASLGFERSAQDTVFRVFGRPLAATEYVTLQYAGFEAWSRSDLVAEFDASVWAKVAVGA